MSAGTMPDGPMPGGSAGDALGTVLSAGRPPEQVSRAPQGIKPTNSLPDVQTLDPSFVGQALLVQFVFTPTLLPLGDINRRPDGAPFAGLTNRRMVSQTQSGWKQKPLAGNGWSTQPADGYSGTLPGSLQQIGPQSGQVVPIDQAI